MSDFEEHFAPEDNDSLDCSNNKIYATRSKNHEKIVKDLKIENLNQIKHKIKKEEEEQVRYLSLSVISKDVEILELKEKIAQLELIIKPIQEFEITLESTCSNIKTYENLLSQVTLKNYKELVKMEIEMIKTHTVLSTTIDKLPKTFKALKYMYSITNNNEDSLREEFHNKLFWNAIIPKNISMKLIEFIIGSILTITLIYILYKMYV